MPSVTYPGTVTPLRGLSPFTESERDVLFGRDRDRDEVARMLGAEGFRAGLLYGEAGVGKTSLLRAGLVPHLRDHGVVALFCEDPGSPIDSFAHALSATGVSPMVNETPMAFLARAVGQSLAGQILVFIVDEIDPLLAASDERALTEIGELFARVVARSGGRARVLFSCASERVHCFGALERRTGSLFPPANRYELGRFSAADASLVLERTLAFANITNDRHLAEDVGQAIARRGGALGADIQIAALALRELKIRTAAELAKHDGGASELDRGWLSAVARSTGNERSALWLLAELADGPSSPEAAAAHVGLDPTVAVTSLTALRAKGVVRSNDDGVFSLAHEILAPRVREIAAPARLAARHAFDLLAARAKDGKRVPLRQLRALRREGVVPTNAAQRAVLDKSRRFWRALTAVAIALPIGALIAIYLMMSGRYYLDIAERDGSAHLVVRAGRPGFSVFSWMPASPGFGTIVADTGFSRAMIDPAQWSRIGDHAISGARSGDAFVDAARATLTPALRALLTYATTGDEAILEQLRATAQGPDQVAALLLQLAPIAHGGAVEVNLVETSLRDPSLAVQTAALAVAGAAAQRRHDVYEGTLSRALTAADPELRRLAFAAVRSLPAERTQAMFAAALAADPEPAARRELLALAATSGAPDKPSPSSAAAVLGSRELATPARDRARAQLRRAFAVDVDAATAATLKLASDDKANPEERVFAIDLLRELAPDGKFAELVAPAKAALDAKAETVRAAALPLYARVAASEAAGQLTEMSAKPDAKNKGGRVALALAWGEIARAKGAGAEDALARLMKDDSSQVRAAAAEAYGYVGRAAQEALANMVKVEGFEVAVGAAYGLANSAAVGASASVAASAVFDLWKRNGKPRRDAARVYGRMASKPTREVVEYLASASRHPEDAGLHPIGAEGLCTAANAGNADARRALTAVADDEAIEVRRLVIGCVADNPELAKMAPAVAMKLKKDLDAGIRAEAARVLAQSAGKGKVSDDVATALIQLLGDDDREVRLIAVRAVAALGPDAAKEAGAALARAFDRGDDAEKLGALRAARALGSGDLVQLAIADPSPLVRVEAIDTAIATGTAAAATISSALTDADPAVRRAALTRLASDKDKLPADAIDRALALAVRDSDESISLLALTTLARIADKEAVQLRLSEALRSRSEADRARAAAATLGLVERDAALAVKLLTPLLDDPSHDVRAAVLPSLAAAYAATNSPEQLAVMLRGAESHAMRRLAATAAFLVLASTEAGKSAAAAALAQTVEHGPPLARMNAKLAQGLIAGDSDGLAFVQMLAP